jgi:hypothetical protein
MSEGFKKTFVDKVVFTGDTTECENTSSCAYPPIVVLGETLRVHSNLDRVYKDDTQMIKVWQQGMGSNAPWVISIEMFDVSVCKPLLADAEVAAIAQIKQKRDDCDRMLRKAGAWLIS